MSGALVAGALGALAGIAAAAMSGGGTTATASYAASLDLRDAPIAPTNGGDRQRGEIIEQILIAGAPERLEAPRGGDTLRPKIVLIFDDVGLDRKAFRELLALPGPLTLSFLPYAENVQDLVDEAREQGDDILLHLPMEASSGSDPGPGSLKTSMSQQRLFDALAENLKAFDGYAGVNNHMGSKFTRDDQAMKRVLALLDQRGLFFIDSLTTGSSVAAKAGEAVGAQVFTRDVFLDAEPGAEVVRRQLALVEKIAEATGYAIVICHPRRETLDVVGPWLTTALARGFELATAKDLAAINGEMASRKKTASAGNG